MQAAPAAVVWAWILVWAWIGTAEGRAVARSACRVRVGRLALVGEVVAIPVKPMTTAAIRTMSPRMIIMTQSQ